MDKWSKLQFFSQLRSMGQIDIVGGRQILSKSIKVGQQRKKKNHTRLPLILLSFLIRLVGICGISES